METSPQRPENYKDVRTRDSNNYRKRAPLAAAFEDCTQTFQELCAIIEIDPSLLESCGFRIKESQSKFVGWGNETGASRQLAFDRNLDYTLRKASGLQRDTLKLLDELHESLQQAVQEIREVSAAAARGFADDVHFDSNNPTRNDPFSVTIPMKNLDVPYAPQDSIPDPENKNRNNSPAPRIVDDESLSEDLLEHITHLHHFVDIEDTIAGLRNIIPVLIDPEPLNTYSEYATSSQAQDEIEIVQRMFPKISSFLPERLGSANWKRRLYVEELSDRAQRKGPKNAPPVRRKVKSRSSSLQGFTDIPQMKDIIFQTAPKKVFRRTRSITSFVTSKAEASSVHGSMLSSGILYNVSMTEPSTIEPDHATGWHVNRLSVPPPPTSLDSRSRFICPYCLLEIRGGDQITSISDWSHHVFMDLEPYLCTFENCVRPDKMFGSLEEWFRHELSSHRVSKVWSCPLCEEKLDNINDFEEHLKKQYKDQLPPDQISSMISSCERFSEKPLSDLQCPICQVSVQKIEKFKNHLADHLEQLSLTSIVADEDSGDSENDDSYENNSETRVKLELVNDFVKEQFNLLIPGTSGPPDEGQEPSNLDFVGDDSEDEPESAVAVPSKPAEDDLWKIKVETFLDTQSQAPSETAKLDPDSHSDSVRRHSTLEVKSKVTGPIRTKPPPRSEEFVGRDEDFSKIHSELCQRGRIFVLSGTPGIGKTTISVEYTYRYAKEYAYIFWVQAETSIGSVDTFGLIATQLNLAGGDTIQDHDRLVMLSREFLEKTQERWLLIFDNVNDGADVKQFLPSNFPKTYGSVLVTTRRQDFRSPMFASQCVQVNLGPLKLEEGRRFLLLSMEPGSKIENLKLHPEYKAAGDITSLVERLPLALSQIAGYVRSSKCTLEEFLELWKERQGAEHSSHLAHHPASSGQQALETIWNIGQSELKMDGLALLHILAFLDNDNIPKRLLVGQHGLPSLEFLHPSQAIRYRRMITELRDRRLIYIKEDQNAITMHQVLQSNILKALSRDIQRREQVFTQAFELVRSRFPRASVIQVPEPTKWPTCKEYLPHVVTLRKRFFQSNPPIAPTLALAKLIADGGFHLWERGVIIQGLSLLREAEAILNKLDCEEDLLRGDIHIIIALLIQYFGISHRAETLDRLGKTLQIRHEFRSRTPEPEYTREHEVLLFNAWSDYGGALLQYNRYEDAEPIFHKCFSKYQEWGTEENIPFEYAKFHRHVAFCRLYHGRFSSAIEHSENGVRLMAMAIGESFHIHAFKFDLACIFLQSGDLVKALELHEEVLSARVKLHGPSGLLTLQSYYAIGALNAYLGNLQEAERWMRRAIEQASRASWPEVAVARTEFHLGQILHELGKDLDEARVLTANAEIVLEKLLPLDPLRDVPEEDKLALFDHLQPLFDGRFTNPNYLRIVTNMNKPTTNYDPVTAGHGRGGKMLPTNDSEEGNNAPPVVPRFKTA